MNKTRLLSIRGIGESCFYLLYIMCLSGDIGDASFWASCCGWDRKKAYKYLGELTVTGFADRINYRGWRASPTGFHLAFNGDLVMENSKAENSTLPGSSSYLINSKSINILNTTTNERPKIVLSGKRDEIIKTIQSFKGVGLDKATKAVDSALSSGEEIDALETRVCAWMEYLKVQNMNANKGFVLAARIKDGTPAPEVEVKSSDPYGGYDQYQTAGDD